MIRYITCLAIFPKDHLAGPWKQQVTSLGRSALHVAAANDQTEAVALLLAEGLSASHPDVFGQTAVDVANEFASVTCERLLRGFYARNQRIPGSVSSMNVQPSPAGTTRGKADKQTRSSTAGRINLTRSGREQSDKRRLPSATQRPSSVTSLAVYNSRPGYVTSLAVRNVREHSPFQLTPAPRCSPAGSHEDLTTDQATLTSPRQKQVRSAYTGGQGTSFRAQSARYYKTKYHLAEEEDPAVPKPR